MLKLACFNTFLKFGAHKLFVLMLKKIALSHACILLIHVLLTRVDHSYKDKQKMAVMLIMTMKGAFTLVSWCLHLLIYSCCTPQQQYCLVCIVILSS